MSLENPPPSGRAGVGRRSDGFRALHHAGYRIYFVGMLIRGTAVWMQLISLPWYALVLGASPGQLGLVVGLQFLPTLVISPIGGVLADRLDRARVLQASQFGSFFNSAALCALALSGQGSLLPVALLALVFGVLTAIELPARQAYLTELVPRDDVTSAVSLHATAWNTTRFIGPGVAGVFIATIGVAGAFGASALMAIGVFASLVYLERHRYHAAGARLAGSGVLQSLLEAARFSAAEPRIRWSLISVAAAGILGIQSFQTLSPLYVSETLGLGGGAYGAFMAMWGGGAVIAAYLVTLVAKGDRRPWLIGGGAGMATLLGSLAIVDEPMLAFAIVVGLGAAQIALVQNAMITVQQAAPDHMRGRVMGFYTTVFQGTSPFGAFFAGWLAESVGVRWTLGVGAAALGIVVIVVALAFRRSGRSPRTALARG